MYYDERLLTPSAWVKEPFPHAVIDELWDRSLLLAALDGWPQYASTLWKTYADPRERGKKAIDDPRYWGGAVRLFFEIANALTTELTQMTGIDDLSADPLGGGMHVTGPDGRLGMHVDFNYHPDGRVRRLNLLTYLNEEWSCEWGGCLYLGGGEGQVCVEPLFNRTVIFECSEKSWHGHPDPVSKGRMRKSLATYFYTPPGSVDLGDAHSTIYRDS